nr:hypothetical protein [Kribbella sp. VKM Ac-2571]
MTTAHNIASAERRRPPEQIREQENEQDQVDLPEGERRPHRLQCQSQCTDPESQRQNAFSRPRGAERTRHQYADRQ